jgi:competence protein ComEC
MNKKLLTILFIIVIAFIFTSIKGSGNVRGIEDGSLVVYFLDIGQGDATLIRTPEGNDILIDGGPDNMLVQKLGEYLPFYDRVIETIILTHPDSDHVTGLVEVLKRYDVEQIIMTGANHESANYKIFLDNIDSSTEIKFITSPEIVQLGEFVAFDVLWPKQDWQGLVPENVNNTSIAGRVIYASTSIMMTGDLESEELLLDLNVELDSDIYQVGHHGANNANDLKFVEEVQPEYSVISAGENNRFGHPNYRTLKNLERVKSNILRTDILGDIIFISNGSTWENISI